MKQIDFKVLLALMANSGGLLVALSALRLVSSEEEESVSAWCLDKCWVRGWRREEQQMYKIIQIFQPARRVYDTYYGSSSFRPLTTWNFVSERQLHYTVLYWLLVRSRRGRPCVSNFIIQFMNSSFPFHSVLISVLVPCLFRQGATAQTENEFKRI